MCRKTGRLHEKPLRINKFSKVAGCRINEQKYVAFLCTIREAKTILFTIASERKKYLGINLTKKVKDLYVENYKTLKKLKIHINGKIFHGRILEELIFKNAHATQSNLHIQCNPYRNSYGTFHRNRTNLKFVWNHKRP